MSSFCGSFPRLPGVACDRFDSSNTSADQFFLSHCHSGTDSCRCGQDECDAPKEGCFSFSPLLIADHMVGLDALSRDLRRRNAVRVNHRIYCSMISKAFVVRKYPGLQERFVKDLFPDEPVVIDVFDKKDKSMYKLRVTAIPANHCPGSVM